MWRRLSRLPLVKSLVVGASMARDGKKITALGSTNNLSEEDVAALCGKCTSRTLFQN